MHRLVVALVVVLSSGALAGCIGGPLGLGSEDGPSVDCDGLPGDGVRAAPVPVDADRSADPGQPWDALLVGNASRDLAVGDVTAPQGWSATTSALGNKSDPVHQANGSLVSRVRLEPEGAPEPGRLSVGVSPTEQPSDCRVGPLVRNHSLAVEDGEDASAGQGVHVHTAGFWPNGTLFYTNIDRIHGSDWRRAGWYAWGGGDALDVYVYEDEPSDRPAYWDVSPELPVAGETTLWSYGPTIPGFNEALKGLSTTAHRVVKIPADQAYTRDGYEDHPLYGDDLIFSIRIADVVDRPCRTAVADTCYEVPSP